MTHRFKTGEELAAVYEDMDALAALRFIEDSFSAKHGFTGAVMPDDVAAYIRENLKQLSEIMYRDAAELVQVSGAEALELNRLLHEVQLIAANVGIEDQNYDDLVGGTALFDTIHDAACDEEHRLDEEARQVRQAAASSYFDGTAP